MKCRPSRKRQRRSFATVADASGSDGAMSLLVDRQVVRRDAEDQDTDGRLVERAVGGLAAAVVPRPVLLLVAGTQEHVPHPLVILLPHLAAVLVERVGGVVLPVPVVRLALAAAALHVLD